MESTTPVRGMWGLRSATYARGLGYPGTSETRDHSNLDALWNDVASIVSSASFSIWVDIDYGAPSDCDFKSNMSQKHRAMCNLSTPCAPGSGQGHIGL